MTEFLNKDVPIANAVNVNGGDLYPWMVVKAGGGTSEFSEIRMRGPIYDENGNEISGGSSSSGSTTSLIWRPGGTEAPGIITTTLSSQVNAKIISSPELKILYLDDSVQPITMTTAINCDNRVEVVPFLYRSTQQNENLTINLSKGTTGILGGSFYNCPSARNIFFAVADDIGQPVFKYTSTGGGFSSNLTNITISGNSAGLTPYIEININSSHWTLNLKNVSIPDKSTTSPAILLSTTGTATGPLLILADSFTVLPIKATAISSDVQTDVILSGGITSYQLNAPQTNTSTFSYSSLSPKNIESNDSIGGAIIQKVLPLVDNPNQLKDTMYDMINCIKQMSMFTYGDFRGNINDQILLPNVPQDINLNGHTFVISEFGANNLRPDIQMANRLNFITSSIGGIRATIEYHFTIVVVANAGNSDLNIYLELDGVEQLGRKVFELPNAGQTFTTSGLILIRNQWIIGQNATFRIELTSGDANINVTEGTLMGKPIPFNTLSFP